MRLNVVKISNFLFKIIKNTLIFFISIFQILKLTEEYIYILRKHLHIWKNSYEFKKSNNSILWRFCGRAKAMQFFISFFFDTSHHSGHHTPRERKLRIFFKGWFHLLKMLFGTKENWSVLRIITVLLFTCMQSFIIFLNFHVLCPPFWIMHSKYFYELYFTSLVSLNN